MSIKRGMVYPDNSLHNVEIKNTYLTTDDEVIIRYYDMTLQHEMFTLLKEENGKYLKNPYHKKLNEYKIKNELPLDLFEKKLFSDPVIGCYIKGKENKKQGSTNFPTKELYVVINDSLDFKETDFVVFENKETNDDNIVKFTRKNIDNRMIYEAVKRARLMSPDTDYKINFLGTTIMLDGTEYPVNYDVCCSVCADEDKFSDSYKLQNDESAYVINPYSDQKYDTATIFCKGYNGEFPMRINQQKYEMINLQNKTSENHIKL